MRPKVNVYTGHDELAAALSSHVAQLSATAYKEQGCFRIALSGGSLIGILGPALCAEPWRDSIDWTSWHVFWTDERWVPSNSPESNCGLAMHSFLGNVDIPGEQIHCVDDELNPSATALAYESTLAKIFQPPEGHPPRFDLILLGIGEDGHTASLFPDHPVLAETRRWVVPVLDAPKPPPIRITMTLPLINNANNLAFFACGPGKAEIVSKVLTPRAQEPKLPANLVNPADGELQWFIDQAAVTKSGFASTFA